MTAFDDAVGALLRVKRKAAKKSLKEAGKHIGLSEGQMSRKESGEFSVSSEQLSKLAGLYKCAVSDLVPKAKAKKGERHA